MASRRNKQDMGKMWTYKYRKEREDDSKNNQEKEVSEEEHKKKLKLLKNIGLI